MCFVLFIFLFFFVVAVSFAHPRSSHGRQSLGGRVLLCPKRRSLEASSVVWLRTCCVSCIYFIFCFTFCRPCRQLPGTRPADFFFFFRGDRGQCSKSSALYHSRLRNLSLILHGAVIFWLAGCLVCCLLVDFIEGLARVMRDACACE